MESDNDGFGKRNDPRLRIADGGREDLGPANTLACFGYLSLTGGTTGLLAGVRSSPVTLNRIAHRRSFQHIGPLNDWSPKTTANTSGRCFRHQEQAPGP